MNIITGYTGTEHVTSNADQGYHQGLFGKNDCVLNVGNKFAATMSDATTVTIQSGEGYMQGVHFRIEPGETETVSISAGTSGYNRVDYICARYTKDVSTGVEAVSLVTIEGTPTASSPSDPSYNTGDILNGGTLVDFPLYKVVLSGVSPTLVQLFNLAVSDAKILLWENTNSEQIGAVTLPLDLSNFREIEVVYVNQAQGTDDRRYYINRHLVGQQTFAADFGIGTAFYFRTRAVNVLASGVTYGLPNQFYFYEGTASVSTLTENYLVPMKIYGVV